MTDGRMAVCVIVMLPVSPAPPSGAMSSRTTPPKFHERTVDEAYPAGAVLGRLTRHAQNPATFVRTIGRGGRVG